MATTTDALSVRGLTKNYGDFALSDVSFSIKPGCIMGLVGENGAGKSTVIRLILGLRFPDGGEIEVLGRTSPCAEVKEQLGVVTDENLFADCLTVGDIRLMMRSFYKTFDGARFDGYVDLFELPRRKKLKDLSRGMRMKVSIAAALGHDSRLLILDEATSGLDPVVRDEILDILRDYCLDGERSVLISSHILSDLEKVCDYVTFLHRGRVVLTGAEDDLAVRFAVAKFTAAQFESFNRALAMGFRRGSFGVEALLERRDVPQGVVWDPAGLEDIMLYIAKSEVL